MNPLLLPHENVKKWLFFRKMPKMTFLGVQNDHFRSCILSSGDDKNLPVGALDLLFQMYPKNGSIFDPFFDPFLRHLVLKSMREKRLISAQKVSKKRVQKWPQKWPFFGGVKKWSFFGPFLDPFWPFLDPFWTPFFDHFMSFSGYFLRNFWKVGGIKKGHFGVSFGTFGSIFGPLFLTHFWPIPG